MNSMRISHFRRHTEGYTGQKKNAYRTFKISYTIHDQYLKTVRHLIETKFDDGMSAADLTQFVRGELYFHLDSLLSIVTSTTVEDLPAISEFV